MRRIKFIQYKDGTWGARTKGWFGKWVYLNESFDPMCPRSFEWTYSVPLWGGKFVSKRACADAMEKYYHSHRKLQVMDKYNKKGSE